MYLFLDISLVQDDEVGDGTTSVTVLACELLKVKKESMLTVSILFNRKLNSLLHQRFTHRR